MFPILLDLGEIHLLGQALPMRVGGYGAFLLLALAALPGSAEPVDVPRTYWVQGLGQMTVSGPACCAGYTFEGSFETHLTSTSSGSLELSGLGIQLNPTVIEHVGVLGLGRLNLFCASAVSALPAAGWHSAGAIALPAGAVKLGVRSYDVLQEDGTCAELNLGLEVENTSTVTGLHDPAGNRFSLSGSLVEFDGGEAYTFTFVLEGVYVNRPPNALLGLMLPGIEQGGCPATWMTGNPPRKVIEANHPAGLLVPLRSFSWDEDVPLSPWADLATEAWYHQKDAAPFTFLGAGRELGPQLFPYGCQHRLRLLVGDHQGALSSDECLFEVIDTTPPVVKPPKAGSVTCTVLWGATPDTSPELAAWLAGATAFDAGDGAPVALPPRIWGTEVGPSSLFTLARWAGAIPVEFRFRDASGNESSAVSTITILDGPACPDK